MPLVSEEISSVLLNDGAVYVPAQKKNTATIHKPRSTAKIFRRTGSGWERTLSKIPLSLIPLKAGNARRFHGYDSFFDSILNYVCIGIHIFICRFNI